MVFFGLKFEERFKESEYFSINQPRLQRFFDVDKPDLYNLLADPNLIGDWRFRLLCHRYTQRVSFGIYNTYDFILCSGLPQFYL